MRNIQHASNRSVLELQILTLVSTTDVMRTCFIERWCVYSHLAFDRHQIIQSAWTRGDTRHQSFRGQLLLRTTRERIERRGRERFQVWCSDHAWDHTHFSRHVTSFQRSSGFSPRVLPSLTLLLDSHTALGVHLYFAPAGEQYCWGLPNNNNIFPMSLSPAQLGSKRFMYLQEHIRFLEHVRAHTYTQWHKDRYRAWCYVVCTCCLRIITNTCILKCHRCNNLRCSCLAHLYAVKNKIITRLFSSAQSVIRVR